MLDASTGTHTSQTCTSKALQGATSTQQEGPLWDMQRELEGVGFAEGQRRFRKAHEEALAKGQGTRSMVLHKMMGEGVERVEAAIKFFQQESQGKRGRKHTLHKWVEIVGADVLAYLTMQELLDGIAARRVYRAVAEAIATRVQDEARYRLFKREAEGLYKYRTEKNRRTRNKRHIKYSMDQSLRWAGVDDSDLLMGKADRLYIGTKLIELAETSTGLFTIEQYTRRGNFNGQRRSAKLTTDKYLLATPAAFEWIARRAEAMELLFPVAAPLVITPLPWGPGKRGGYHFQLKGRYALVRGAKKPVQRKVAESATDVVYDALNALQRTRWSINKDVLRVAQEITDRGGEVAGLPSFAPLNLPPKPAGFAALPEGEQRAWKKAASERIEEERQRTGLAFKTRKVLSVAEKLEDVQAIYFAWSCDFRGRVYPLSTYLHPQGDDLCRGLLTFADAKPLGDRGDYWLCVHGANTIDEVDGIKVSKLSFDERVRFIHDRHEQLLETAAEPMSNRWWMDLEAPFQVLAFCMEYAGMCEWAQEHGTVETYPSRLPVMLDGTCNGAQHWSAALRDERGGASVNLLPSDRPNDLYTDVCDRLLSIVQRDASDDPMALLWMQSPFITRTLVKTPSMTFFYGSGKFGFRDQVVKTLRKKGLYEDARAHFGQRVIPAGSPVLNHKGEVTGHTDKDRCVDNIGAAASYIAVALDEALHGVVRAAHEGRMWLQSRARAIAAKNSPVEWTVPLTGFHVRQDYYQSKRHQIRTMVNGQMTKPSFWIQTPDIDTRRQQNAISPNVIHSLDAAALMLTIDSASAHGVSSLSMIHDSYGTHAADTEVLRMSTRQAFYHLYTSVDVPAYIEEQLLQQIGEDEKAQEEAESVPMPERGNLDIGEVLVSDYFFA